MKLIFLLLLCNGTLGQFGFGVSYLKNSRLCQPWICINQKLGFDDSLPSRASYAAALTSLLPDSWHSAVDSVLDVCYSPHKPRTYTNTCPGQALLHCVVDNLINHCPEDSIRKDDACAPVTSLAGFNYMFAQSRYANLERNLPMERRPPWFLKNYFNVKCCDLPELFNSTVLSECWLTRIIHYYDHVPRPKAPAFGLMKNIPEHTTTAVTTLQWYTATTETDHSTSLEETQDPFDCCDMSDFIAPTSRSECNFQLTWTSGKRLDIIDHGPQDTTTTEPTVIEQKNHDVMIVPVSCPQETCVFDKLNITFHGSVNTEAFSKLLDNFTKDHPEWSKAKARVVTKCLSKPVKDYEAECDINKVLACTFDVLSENCPHLKKASSDPCRHTSSLKNHTICQINSSKYRAKNRRQYCDFPRFVNHQLLADCGISSISQIQPVMHTIPSSNRKHSWLSHKPMCKDTTPAARCLMSKMGVLNKYNFLDYFKMKDRIRHFTSTHPEWSNFTDLYVSTFTGMPLYREYCTSQKKFLNIVDVMLMTCPISKRKDTDQCKKIFTDIKTPPGLTSLITEKNNQHMFMLRGSYPNQLFSKPRVDFTSKLYPKKRGSLFDQSIFHQMRVPPVSVIPIRPTKMYAKPNTKILVRTPVYMNSMTTETVFETTSSSPLYEPPFRHVPFRDALLRSAQVPRQIDASADGSALP